MTYAVYASLEALLRRLKRQEGQTMIEYALLAGVVSIAAIAVIALIGPYLKTWFQDVVNAFGLT